MYRKFLNARSPLRLLEKGLHGGLGRGNLGVVLAGHGVGKTSFLVCVGLDELLRGEVAPGYRLARRNEPSRRADGKPLPLLDDPHTGVRAYLMTLPPNGSGELGFAHKGVEVVAVSNGLVQVILPTGRPVLRRGEALLAERSEITACRNLTDEEATLFWILRDETGERQTARPV